MGIQPVLIYVIRGLEPKFHWDGMKNESSTYDIADKSRCEAINKPFLRLQASKTFQLFPES